MIVSRHIINSEHVHQGATSGERNQLTA